MTGQTGRETGLSWLTLFASTGTLICCALPVILVTLGLGSAVAAVTGSLPWLIILSRHKEWVFAGSALMLALAGWALFRPGRACPIDPQTGELCDRAQRWNRLIFGLSVMIWVIGFSFAWLALPIRRWLEG